MSVKFSCNLASSVQPCVGEVYAGNFGKRGFDRSELGGDTLHGVRITDEFQPKAFKNSPCGVKDAGQKC